MQLLKAVLKSGECFILHIELQDSNDSIMHWRMMRYYTDIALANPGIPIRQYVIYTGGPPLAMTDAVQDAHWVYRYTMIDMHNLDCERFIEEDNPDGPKSVNLVVNFPAVLS